MSFGEMDLARIWSAVIGSVSGFSESLTYTVLTTDPNERMEPADNRIPVILEPKEYHRGHSPFDCARLLVDLQRRTLPAERMVA